MAHLAYRLQWVLAAVLFLAFGCASVPVDRVKPYSESIVANTDTHFGDLASGWAKQNSGKSGFCPFQFGMDALGARLDMVKKAEKTIDLQYFLMKDDADGSVISTALIQAADRGVRIRFRLDDIVTTAPDDKLLQLAQRPNIQVRLLVCCSKQITDVSLQVVTHLTLHRV